MTESFAQRLARLESENPPIGWGLARFEFAVPRTDGKYVRYLEGMVDEDLIRVMFTKRDQVTLNDAELAAADELTLNLLDAPD